MTKSERVEKAEELRKYIASKGMSKKGLERVLSVIMTSIGELDNKKDTSYQLIYAIVRTPEKMVDTMYDTCVQNGEVEEDDE